MNHNQLLYQNPSCFIRHHALFSGFSFSDFFLQLGFHLLTEGEHPIFNFSFFMMLSMVRRKVKEDTSLDPRSSFIVYFCIKMRDLCVFLRQQERDVMDIYDDGPSLSLVIWALETWKPSQFPQASN